MAEPNVEIRDTSKAIVCGEIGVDLHLGPYAFVRLNPEVKIDQILNLISALHTAHDIAVSQGRA